MGTPSRMARSDLIISLVRAATSGDRGLLRSTVEAMAADEKAKRHDVVADRLLKALNAPTNSPATFAAPATSNGAGNGKDFIAETTPRQRLQDLFLDPRLEEQIEELISEHQRVDLLRSYGMQPRHRVLLAGPPGNGKTSLAEAVAEALAVPFFVVRYDALIGSFLGETNQRLKRLFDYVRTTPCVLLFDEFDALGKERGDIHETGEIKRVVSNLLLQIDALPSYVLLIAATNHEELLDRAAWRRFELRLSVDAPTEAGLEAYVRHVFVSDGGLTKDSMDAIRGLRLSSYAEAADFSNDVRRRLILAQQGISLNDAIRSRVQSWAHRMRVPLDGYRSDEAATDVRSTSAGRPKKGSASIHAAPTTGGARTKSGSGRPKVRPPSRSSGA